MRRPPQRGENPGHTSSTADRSSSDQAPEERPVPPPGPAEEALVTDGRAQVRPAQYVEQKLFHLLKAAPLPMSQVRVHGRPNDRRHC